MLKYQIKNSRGNDESVLRNMIFGKTLTAPEIGVYSILNLAGSEINFKNHLLDSMEQISTWLTNLKEHGYIEIDNNTKTIKILH
jgi:hypothetical protein